MLEPLSPNVPVPMKDATLMTADDQARIALLGNLRKTPIVLYGIFLELTRQFYSDADNLPLNVQQTWNQDAKLSKIWIDTEYRWEDDNPEFRPAIYLKLGELQYSSLSGRHDSKVGMDLEEGEYHYQRSAAGTISWVHVARSKGESVMLAGATLDYLDALSDIIRCDFCFDTFELATLTPMQLDKESKERYRSVVTCKFTCSDSWAVKQESPKLKRIVFDAGRGLDGLAT